MGRTVSKHLIEAFDGFSHRREWLRLIEIHAHAIGRDEWCYGDGMCSHYQAPTAFERIRLWAGLRELSASLNPGPGDVWPLYRAPILRRDPDRVEHVREVVAGQFGMLAHWAKDITQARKTYNARTETVATKPSYRDAWKRGQRCVIPAEWIFEPSYELPGRPVPWKIRHAQDQMLGIAGLWSRWRAPAGGEDLLTFTMLTINAEDHPLMRRFHRPEDEKRMVVILDPADYDRWLDCPAGEMMGMMRQYPADLLTSEPAPRPPSKKAETVKSDPQQGELL